MTDPGYVELFTMTSVIIGRSLEQWAGAMMEDVAAARHNADQWKSQTDRRRHHACASTHGTQTGITPSETRTRGSGSADRSRLRLGGSRRESTDQAVGGLSSPRRRR